MKLAEQLRAGRGILDWNQQKLADAAGISKSALVNIEKESVEPETRTIRKLYRAFEAEGVFFEGTKIEKRSVYSVEFDSYLEVLEDIEKTLPDGGEVLVHCADDSKSSTEVVEKLRQMRTNGFTFKVTICEGNEEIHGKVSEYRWIDAEYFADSQVEVIYKNKVVVHVAGTQTFTGFVGKEHAKNQRKQFDYWWRKGKPVQ